MKISAYFTGMPGGPQDAKCCEIFERYDGIFVGAGTELASSERGVEYDMPYGHVVACRTALMAARFRLAPAGAGRSVADPPPTVMKMDKKFYAEIRKAKDGTVVPDDEYVVFLIKDTAFARVLPEYYAECKALGADERQLQLVNDLINRVDTWRRANPDRCKVPDAAGEKLLD